MPKGIPKSKIEESIQVAKVVDPQIVETDKRITNLESSLEKITELVVNMSTIIEEGQRIAAETPAPTKTPVRDIEKEIEAEGTDSIPLPQKWVEAKNRLLGTDFTMEIKDVADGNFMMTVWLPDHLDRRVGDRTGKDLSTGLIRRTSALADVEVWCSRIAGNIKKNYPDFKPLN